MVEYPISSDKAADTPDKWASFIRRARSKKGADQQSASTLVLVGMEGEVLRATEDWQRVYVAGAEE